MYTSRLLKVAILFLICASQHVFAQIDTITIVSINDSHSALAPAAPHDETLRGTQGGIARAASAIGYIKQTEPHVLTVHAGDFAIGDIFYNTSFGVPELRILAMLGLDAMTLGNHEFDLTPAMLQLAFDTAFAAAPAFPILSANAVMEDSSVAGLKQYVTPYTIKQAGNTSVGILGLTTPETNLLSQPAPVFLDTNILEIAAATIAEMKEKGCNVIILLSHLGYELDSIVATYIPGIDAIISGHDHYLFETPRLVQSPSGSQVPIVQAGSHYSHVGKLQLLRNGSAVSLLNYAVIPLDASVPEEPTVRAIVDTLIAGIEAVYGPVFTMQLATATDDFDEVSEHLTEPGWHDTHVGNLCTDAFRAATKTDVAIQVGGSTAQQLFKGPLVGDDIFRMVGYGFNTDNGLGYRLATFTIPGAALAAGLEYGLSDIEHNDEFFVQVSGMQYTYDPSLPVFSRLTGVTINGTPLDTAKLYTVTANEFAVLFMSTIGLPISDIHIYTDTTEFQIISSYIMEQGGTIRPVRDGRISSATLAADHVGPVAATRFLDFIIQPNPCHSETRILLKEIAFDAHVTIVSMEGNMVFARSFAATDTLALELPNLTEGIYLCKVVTKGQVGLKLLHITH